MFTCEVCNVRFEIDWRISQRGLPRFCSRSCSAKHVAAISHQRLKERLDKTPREKCPSCEKILEFDNHHRVRKFCTPNCKSLFQNKLKIESWLITGKIPEYTGGKSACLPGRYIRRFLLKEQNGLCAICQSPQIHYNQPLVFIMDHVDGDPTYNERLNLRMICPNCNSQTPTFTGRNKSRGRRSRGFVVEQRQYVRKHKELTEDTPT